MQNRIVEIIIRNLATYYNDDPDFGPVALASADEILSSPEFQKIRKALDNVIVAKDQDGDTAVYVNGDLFGHQFADYLAGITNTCISLSVVHVRMDDEHWPHRFEDLMPLLVKESDNE